MGVATFFGERLDNKKKLQVAIHFFGVKSTESS